MTDREKTVAALDKALVQMHGCGRYTPEDVDELETAAWGALKLLEPIEPIEERINEIDCIYRCGNCKTHFYYRQQKYCAICGKAVKWDAN